MFGRRLLVLIGRRVAPPRFVLFGLTFLLVTAAGLARLPDPRLALMLGFDVAALAFFISAYPLLDDDTHHMRKTAQDNDANRALMLTLTVLIMLVILYSVFTLVREKAAPHPLTTLLIVCTLVLAWLFANTVFALHYAHMYYLPGADVDGDRGGLQVPGTDDPTYWDFMYFSFTLGMTFQTADVTINSRHIRRVVLGHSMAAFAFNIGVLAFTINSLGGS